VPSSLPGALLNTACLVLLSVGLGGCMAHTPTRIDLASPGSQVQITVDRERVSEGTAFLVDLMGPALRGTLLENQVSPAGPRSLLLLVPTPQGGGPVRGESLGQRVRIQETEILSIELRSVDRARTALAVGAGAAALAVVVAAIVSGRSGGSGDGPPSGPDQLRNPRP
jgi:hypothetical protein